MNINYAIANSIHSLVVNEALVDSHLLLDDHAYTSLLTNLINKDHMNVDIQLIKASLLDYVNNNY
tara:strand:- start:334 stop:528 length:195 start_codon:yes stop_codon:yes gene_type:complete